MCKGEKFMNKKIVISVFIIILLVIGISISFGFFGNKKDNNTNNSVNGNNSS